MRRRPRQGRAQASAQALLDAFVRVLLERGYPKTTIREVVAVAGVGVGTFYEYFGNKHALAALWIHQRVQALECEIRAAVLLAQGQPLACVVQAAAEAHLSAAAAALPEWEALLLLERQISTVEAFRTHYDRWVAMWQQAVQTASDPPADAASAARLLHALCYGWISQSLLAQGADVDVDLLRANLRVAVGGVVASLPREKIAKTGSGAYK